MDFNNQHPSINHVLKRPEGVPAEVCSDLGVRVEHTSMGTSFASFWKPTPDELAALNDGGCVFVAVFGTQPMMQVGVTLKYEQTEN